MRELAAPNPIGAAVKREPAAQAHRLYGPMKPRNRLSAAPPTIVSVMLPVMTALEAVVIPIVLTLEITMQPAVLSPRHVVVVVGPGVLML